MKHYQPMSLSSIEVHQEVELIGFLKGGRIARRLAELGITPRTRITVLQSRPGQPMLIRVRGSHLAIDRAIADQLQVRPLEGAQGRHKRPHKALRVGIRRRLHQFKSFVAGDDARVRPRGWRKRPGRRNRFRRRFFDRFFRQERDQD